MQIVYHYLRLRQHFADRPEGEALEITLSELAEIFAVRFAMSKTF